MLDPVAALAIEEEWVYYGPAPDSWVVEVAIDTSSPPRIYLGDWAGEKSWSEDGGDSWLAFEVDPYGGRIGAFVVDRSTPSTVYAAIEAGLDSGVYKSLDYGKTWADANGGLTIIGTSTLASSTLSPSTLFVGDASQARVFRSVDAAMSWVPVGYPEIPRQVESMVIDPSDITTVYAGTWGAGVFKTVDSGGEWFEANDGMTLPYVEDLIINPSDAENLYVASGLIDPPISHVFETNDGGQSWTRIRTGYTFALALDPRDPETLYAGRAGFDGGGVVVRRDEQDSWQSLGSGLEGVTVSVLVVEPDSPWRILAGTTQGLYIYNRASIFEDGFEAGDTGAWLVVEWPVLGQPSLGQPSLGQPSIGQPSLGQPNLDHAAPGEPLHHLGRAEGWPGG